MQTLLDAGCVSMFFLHRQTTIIVHTHVRTKICYMLVSLLLQYKGLRTIALAGCIYTTTTAAAIIAQSIIAACIHVGYLGKYVYIRVRTDIHHAVTHASTRTYVNR